jgi:hypothetical protein
MGRSLPSAAAARDQARPLEHLQVFADRLERDGGDQCGEFVDRGVTLGEAPEDGPAGRVGERPNVLLRASPVPTGAIRPWRA